MKLKHDLILASSSPRRRDLLSNLGLKFETQSIDIDESFDPNLPAEDIARTLARKKNNHYRTQNSNQIIISADTIVVFGKQVLNKPESRKEAIEMIQKLSDKSHYVITGVCISDKDKTIDFASTTEVHFHKISQEEIEHYIDTYEPFDKAGAYGIQEWIGMMGIKYISGSYFNVVGLPTDEVYRVLRDEFSE